MFMFRSCSNTILQIRHNFDDFWLVLIGFVGLNCFCASESRFGVDVDMRLFCALASIRVSFECFMCNSKCMVHNIAAKCESDMQLLFTSWVSSCWRTTRTICHGLVRPRRFMRDQFAFKKSGGCTNSRVSMQISSNMSPACWLRMFRFGECRSIISSNVPWRSG